MSPLNIATAELILDIAEPVANSTEEIKLPEEMIKGYKDLNDKMERKIVKIHDKRKKAKK